jgi:hypothetical protein
MFHSLCAACGGGHSNRYLPAGMPRTAWQGTARDIAAFWTKAPTVPRKTPLPNWTERVLQFWFRVRTGKRALHD